MFAILRGETVLQISENGLFCPAGAFYIDPWGPVDRAIITHSHADHARPGSKRYLTAQPGEYLLRTRLGDGAAIESAPYERFSPPIGARVLENAKYRTSIFGKLRPWKNPQIRIERLLRQGSVGKRIVIECKIE